MVNQEEQLEAENHNENNGSEEDGQCCMTCLMAFLALTAIIMVGSLFAQDIYLDTSPTAVCMGPHNTRMINTPRFPRHQTLTAPRQRLEFLRKVTGDIWIIDHYADRLPDEPSELRGEDYDYDPVIQAAEWLVHQDTTVVQDDLLQRFALAVIYQSLGGSQWKHSTNWMDTSKSVCNWYGVTCCSTEIINGVCDPDMLEKVMTVDLSHNRLQGTFSDAWILLSELRTVRLNNNRITGGFWGFSFGNLPHLRSAYVQNNLLTGEIHTDLIVESESLEILHLYGNRFTGPISHKMCETKSGDPIIPNLLIDCDRNPCTCCQDAVHCYNSEAATVSP